MFCTQTEEFLREKGVDFTIRNIADDDEEAIAELKRMGTMTTPVTMVGGTDIVVGFDRKKLEQSLGL
jgi:glutaredoxin